MQILTSKNFRQKLKELISQSEKSVKIASAWVKGRTLEELLNSLNGKNINLELILRASEFKDFLITDENVFKIIRKLNGKVYLSNRLHAKFILIDNKIVVVGSANLTEHGLSESFEGNLEVGISYTLEDDKEKVEELSAYFEEIKTKFSVTFNENLLGFTLNPSKPESFEFILVEDGKIELQDYVEIPLEGKTLLAIVDSIYSYDVGFFANPFSSYESKVFAPFEDFVKIFANNNNGDWKKASVYAYLNENGKRVKIATAKVLGFIKDGKLEDVKSPPHVGIPVYKASEESFKVLSKRNLSRKEMEYPVKVGSLKGTSVPLFVDAKEIITKHLLVIGTTGSGKSYFVKTFLGKLVNSYPNLQVFILDPHGEYFEDLLPFVGEEKIEHIPFEDTLFFTTAEAFEEFLTNSGFGFLVSGNSNEVKFNKNLIRRKIKPFLSSLSFSESGILELLKKLEYPLSKEEKKKLKKEILIEETIVNPLKDFCGERLLTNQGEILNSLRRGLNSSKPVVIFNLKEINDILTRVSLAGFIMQELFRQNKVSKKERILVLEEAHNFAPEKAYGDISSGRDNLALVMARKIASEGRKFNLGLITITQRPAQVSKYVLAQMNTQAMFKTINKNDLDTISTFVEYAGRELIAQLPSLPTGIGIFSGNAVPFTVIGEVKTI